MNVSVKGNEQITKLLNDWYQEIRTQHVIKATQLKKELDERIHTIEEDQNLLLYYSLLDFRYRVLTDGFSISKNSFDKIESFTTPTDNFLAYYYHFFKAVHSTILTNYNEARKHYEKAESLLENVSDEVEHAEFNYRVASFYYQMYQPLLAIQYANKANEIFSKHEGYEVNVALCENVLGLSCSELKQHEQAEEYFTSAINILQKEGNETLTLRVRHNLGLLYASQNLSPLAIRHLSEVSIKIPNHFKSIFIEAREHYKLGALEKARELIETGLKICGELENDEYKHHFLILNALCQFSTVENIEKVVLEGIPCFERENLVEYVQEYSEMLAMEFHKKGNIEQAEKYFHKAYEIRQKLLEKGALK
ncbi:MULTISPECIES: Rap family tetratricopeptide repeat protein [unclassified Bacillus (in: firmicutes)]|uniref:Rap family tetratricopeptide repeat protein n=1 Tax=unclassified Bacillus (in: firmicutes) TaxID=185979 RepID=UPI0008E884AE|nr:MULTISPECIES: Rap family tetratricopeptide repeat protein [unclassified Bacillus (in: firmicutes)]SFI36595.1 Tetratricopeptide repeat-containing protein [Bacillus sp. 71mf]SFT24390.1 Tetratricopeptide repeat-containing protein [Bacillus sp. 103mf]SFT24678.1 Tetratricopeptide repeat-containing protein [Bacillus sp. 103mf]